MAQGPGSAESPLFGRSTEIDLLLSGVRRAACGTGAAVFLTGEGGIGKSRLVVEAERLASGEGFSVISGGAFELGRTQAFSLIAEVLSLARRSPDPRASEIARLLADVDGESNGAMEFGSWTSLEFRIIEEIVDFVEDKTAASPVALLLDDLHWGDPASLRVVSTLARRLAAAPLFILGAYRPTPRNPELEAAVRHLTEGTEHVVLELNPLDAEAVSGLVDFHLHGHASGGISSEVARASGNPFLIIELVGRLQNETEPNTERAASSDREFLRTLLARRLRGLSEPAIEMLRIGSVFGSEVSTSEIALITGKPIAELMPLADEALRDGVIVERGDRLAFRHDLIRDALYLDIPEDVRRGLHMAAGRALGMSGGSPLQAASHMAAGASNGDREAFEYIYRAGRETLRASPQVAVQLLTRARELLPPGDPSAHEVEATLAIALSWAGRPKDAAEAARGVLDGPASPVVEGLAETALWNSLAMEGKLLEARELMDRLGDEGPAEGRQRAIQMSFDALTRLFVGEFEGSEKKATIALELARQEGSGSGESVALICLAWTQSTKGRFDKALELSSGAVRIPDHHPFADILHGLILADSGRFEDAERVYRSGLRAAEERGQAPMAPFYHWGMMGLRYYSAEWDDAIAEGETGLALAEQFGVALGILMPYATLSHIAVRRGHLDEAKRLVERGEEQVVKAGPNLGFDRLVGMRASVTSVEHDFDVADYLLVETTWQVIKVAGAAIGAIISTAPELIRGTRLALSKADPDHPLQSRGREFIESMAVDVEGIAAGSRIKGLEASALCCRALVSDDVEAALASVALFRETPYNFHRALVCEDAAVLLARSARMNEALPLFDEMMEVYERAGAAWDVARTSAIMRSLGVRRGARMSRRRPASGWESLTPTEQRVAGLVAEGLTNRQVGERLFLSRHTVDTHLRHVYGKLGLTSRVELAAARASVARQPAPELG